MAHNKTLLHFSLAACFALSGCGSDQTAESSHSSKEAKGVMTDAVNNSTFDVKASPVDETEDEWVSLFNGKDLQGWQTFVSYQPKDSKYQDPDNLPVRGVNNDPKNVFSVQDGLLRISGEEWGGISTKKEYANFHLKFDVKWGDKKWPPRETLPRDSGVLYFAVGEPGASMNHWMRSHEMQIQVGDSGDYHSLDGVLIDTHCGSANQGDWHFYRYDPDMPMCKDIANRVLKLGEFENPIGQWDSMEVIADDTMVIHKINGHEVFRGYHSRQVIDGQQVPLTKGRIEFQSEGAEVFYRNIRIKVQSAAL
ncbi:MAG: 3-keto-disaccharide hydrolase [Paraglaciecola chathamensis]